MAHLKTYNFLVVKFSQKVICNVQQPWLIGETLAIFMAHFILNSYAQWGQSCFEIPFPLWSIYSTRDTILHKILLNLLCHPQQNNISFFTHLFDWPQQFGFETQIKEIRKSFMFVIKIIKEYLLITILNILELKLIGNRKTYISQSQ